VNRKKFFNLLRYQLSLNELRFVQKAYWFAKDVHRIQTRDGGERYFEHCRRVALVIIEERKIFDADTIVTALVHDVIEDTFVPPDAFFNLFGPRTYEWTHILSKNTPCFDEINGTVVIRDKKDIQKYFWVIQNASREVRLVKLSDRLDNLRSFGIWPEERRQRYIRETKEYIVPIALATDPWFVEEFSKYYTAAQ
jgi:GTP diphosphokinase / guanosine-3',5'-bis(diphosphate) 3'-diphosphatase